MKRVALRVIAVVLMSAAGTASAASLQDLEQPVLTEVYIDGASVYTQEDLARRYGLVPGTGLKQTPDAIAGAIRGRYAGDGYTFADVTAALDTAGVLRITIDEGQIDEIEFRGVDAAISSRLREEFAVRPGDIFNRPQASRALDEALAAGHGAIARRHADDTFTLVRGNGRRILEVALRTRSSQNGVFIGTQGREDWYSPVDGFNPAIGFESTIFDAHDFNHTYWGGYVAYKFASERTGFSFGLERPFLKDSVLQVGGSVQDITASDDRWRLSDLEQSLVAVSFLNTFRDYYRRKGYQVHAAVRPFANHEWLIAWRGEEHLSLANETTYSFFRDDEVFRANGGVQEGDLRSLIVGYTLDTRGLTHESPGERYRRHLGDSLFGRPSRRDHGARVEWTSEFAPRSFDQDFDFSRHILNARAWIQTSPSRLLSGRTIVGFSDGVLPPQRLFGLGGIGTVHGYSFKQTAGERMLLFNGEFRQRFGRSQMAAIAFIDAGRVYQPLPGVTADWLKGVGVGVELGGARVEFGWRLDDIPGSLQVLFRLGPTF